MPHRLPRSARLGLTGVKLAVGATLVVAGLASQPTPSGPGYAGFPVDGSPSREARLLDRHHCSTTGFAGSSPASAIIRTARGRLRHVSFDEGWEVYTRRGAASLVAVCLAAAPAQG